MLFIVARKVVFAAALLLVPAAALAAHGTTPLKVVEEIEIDAQPAKVWAIVADFQNWTWLPGVAEIEGTGGNTPDQAKRRLTLNDGGVIEESLTKFDAERMSLGYHVELCRLENAARHKLFCDRYGEGDRRRQVECRMERPFLSRLS